MSSLETKPMAGLSDYLVAERTLLAWIRTGLAMMGFGFVVARFGVLLEELHARASTRINYGLSLWFGTALIAVGVLVNLRAAWSHIQLVRRLDRGDTSYPRAGIQAAWVAFLLALVGLAMTVYLLCVQSTHRFDSSPHQEVSYVSHE